MELEKEFSRFLKIGENIPKKNLLHKFNAFIDKKKIEKQIDYLIFIENFKLLTQFIKNGYRFKNDQIKNLLFNHISLFNDENSELLTHIKQYPEQISKLSRKLADAIDTSPSSVDPREVQKELILLEKIFRCLGTCYQENDKNIEYISKKLYLYHQINDRRYQYLLEQNMSTREQKSKMAEAVNMVRAFAFDLRNAYENIHEEKIQSQLSTTREIYTDILSNMSKNIEESFKDELKQLNLAKLSISNATLAKEIESLIKEIDREKLSVEKKQEMKTLIDVRLPQVFREYFGISEKYREQFSLPDGQTAESLLNSSLKTISMEIHNIVSEQQHDKLVDMKVTNRYLKNRQ